MTNRILTALAVTKTLPDFLEALSEYDNIKLNVNADKPDWSTFADIFKRASMYA